MRVDEILYKLADFVRAAQGQDEETVDAVQGHDKLAQQPDDIMVPPLQQKIELLKKAVGVENIYDEDQEQKALEEKERVTPTPEEEDELEKIKRAAGIPVAAIAELSDDEPLDS